MAKFMVARHSKSAPAPDALPTGEKIHYCQTCGRAICEFYSVSYPRRIHASTISYTYAKVFLDAPMTVSYAGKAQREIAPS